MEIENFASFCKEKGFIYPSSDIYGGVKGLFDYGHLGTLLKKNFENLWRRYFLALNENFYEIETANIMHENVFKASGHLDNFIDPVVKCSKCEFFERADHFLEDNIEGDGRYEELSNEEMTEVIKQHNLTCPKCGQEFKPVEVMNLMFGLDMGVGTTSRAYLRPETAQSPYVNFKQQFEILRRRLPMGLALIGRAYRNEISPRNMTIRQREFTQAELQIFFNPNLIEEHEDFESVKDYELHVVRHSERDVGIQKVKAEDIVKSGIPKFYVYHMVKVQKFYFDVLGFPVERFRLYELNDKEKAFYNKYHFDIEGNLNAAGWTEIGGIHYRTDHDLHGHQDISKQKMEVSIDGQKFIPHVLELSFGVDRNVFSLLDLNLEDDQERGNKVIHFAANVSPVQVAVFPLVNKIHEKAREVFESIQDDFICQYDKSGSVGRRYARQDEMGTPFCVTVDFDSLENEDVTIRDRESTKQRRVKLNELKETLGNLLSKKTEFEKIGEEI